MSEQIPGRGLCTEQARGERLAWLRERVGVDLASAGSTSRDADQAFHLWDIEASRAGE